MYYKYFNFKLNKGKNIVELQADEICVLENIKDDTILGYKKPRCLMAIVNKKLSVSNINQYSIYILKKTVYNRITDYKKIWKLGGFEEKGLFDGYYDSENGRVYLGICKEKKANESNTFLYHVTLMVPSKIDFSFEQVFNVFKKNCFYVDKEKQVIIDTLFQLQKLIKNSIVIYEYPHRAEICIIGQHIESKFMFSDLPTSEIIETNRGIEPVPLEEPLL